MRIPSSGEKPNNLLDLVSNNSEAVKVSTQSKSGAKSASNNAASSSATAAANANERSAVANQLGDEKATSIKFGLAKYIADELDPKKVSEERQAKIAALKAKIADGSYLTSISSEGVVQKLLENSHLESLIYGSVVNDE